MLKCSEWLFKANGLQHGLTSSVPTQAPVSVVLMHVAADRAFEDRVAFQKVTDEMMDLQQAVMSMIGDGHASNGLGGFSMYGKLAAPTLQAASRLRPVRLRAALVSL